jgi:hypothetical protein
MERRLAGLKTADAAMLWSASSMLAGLRYPREFIQSLFSGVRTMKESSTYQAILEEGMAEGMAKAALKAAKKVEPRKPRRILLRLGRKHLGKPAAATLAQIEAIQDVERLEELTERLLEASTWPELLAPRSRVYRQEAEGSVIGARTSKLPFNHRCVHAATGAAPSSPSRAPSFRAVPALSPYRPCGAGRPAGPLSSVPSGSP